MTRQELIDCLKNALAIAEKLPEFQCGAYLSVRIYPRSPDEFRSLAPALVPFDKEHDANSYMIQNKLGLGEACSAQFTLSIDRGKMCRKVKVMKEVEEFQCDDSLLDPTPEVAHASV